MGTLEEKLDYLKTTKNRFFFAMDGLGYDVEDKTFREAVDMLYASALDDAVDALDVSDIDSTYQQNVKDAYRQVLTLGNDYVHFIVTTDMHMMNASYTGYNAQVKPILDALMGTGNFDKVINLGDVLNHGNLTWVQKAKEWGYLYNVEGGDCLFVMGNHDYEDGCVEHFKSEVFDYIAEYDNVTMNPNATNNNAYYYDIPSHKLRLLMVDSNASASQPYISTQFFIDARNNLPSGWKYASFSHHGTLGDSHVLKLQYERDRNYFIGDFRGHDHRDTVSRIRDYAFQTVFAAKYLTVLSINPKYNDVKFFRIGEMRPSFTFGAPDGSLNETAIYGGRNGNSYGFRFNANDIPSRFIGEYRNTAIAFESDSNDPYFDTTVYEKSAGQTKRIYAYRADKTAPTYSGKMGAWYYSTNFYESVALNGQSSGMSYAKKVLLYTINSAAVKYQLFRPEDTLLSDTFPSGFNEAIDNSCWQLGTYASAGAIYDSSTEKVNPEGIIVEAGKTYRFTQPTGNPIGKLRYMILWKDHTQSRYEKSSSNNYVDVTIPSNAWMIRLGVTTPAEDMSTCTFEEVT